VVNSVIEPLKSSTIQPNNQLLIRNPMQLKKPQKPVTYGNQTMVTREIVEEREFAVEECSEIGGDISEEIPAREFLRQVGLDPDDLNNVDSYSLILSVEYEGELNIINVRTIEYQEETEAETLYRVGQENKAKARYQDQLASYKARLNEGAARSAYLESMK